MYPRRLGQCQQGGKLEQKIRYSEHSETENNCSQVAIRVCCFSV
jgi:hypothetical protein